MPSIPSFHSAAGNFVDAVQGSVDPRTGLFSVSLPLLSLRTGDLAGPGLALNLRYSPLSSADEGFGRGFTLNLSRYNSQTRKLQLSTGEEYCISSSGSAVIQQRFRNFIFKKTDDAGSDYQIVYKSGLVETLSTLGSAAYTTRIADAAGRWVGFRWKWANPGYRLAAVSEVKAGKETDLCRVDYPDATSAATTFRVLPGSTASGYDVVFSLKDGELLSVTSHAETAALVWQFRYGSYKPGWPRYLTGMTSPTGLREEVQYAFAGVASARFPDGAGLPALPRVHRHTLSPGGGQPDVLTRWEWTKENHLGWSLHGGHAEWQPDMDLGLMRPLSPDYFYGSTAVLLDADKRTISQVTRRYNSFHLLVAETMRRGAATYSAVTEYPASPGATLNEQPRQYLLPRRKTETFWGWGIRNRTEETQWTFDESGNPLREAMPDGTVTEYAYYPPQGEGDACPADPHGFTRYLKRKTVTPFRVRGDEPVTVETHTWKKLQNSLNDGYVVAGATVTATSGSVRTVISREYYEDAGDPLTYGREKRQTVTLTPDTEKAASSSYTRTETFSYESRETGLFQSAVLTTHDGLSATRSSLRHPVLGLLLSETDAQNVTVSYTYDRSGRVLTRTAGDGTEFARKSAWSYAIDSSGPVTTETDPAGGQVRIRFDGAGREIRRERLDRDATERWFDVSSQSYAITGEVQTRAASDWLTGASAHVPDQQYLVRSGFTYDDWGSLRETSTSDGVVLRQDLDPVGLTQRMVATGRANGQQRDSATSLTELDARSRLPHRETVTGNGAAVVRSFEWDGIGQLRQGTDENGKTTQYTYDVLGRLLTQILPDDTVISRTYAPHLTGNQVVSISVTGKGADGQTKTWLQGTQAFDGLGRLTGRVSGGRSTTYAYNGASPVPATVTLPSGKTLTYRYIPELGHALSSVTADGLTRTFTYASPVGSLVTATAGENTDSNTFAASGSLTKEVFTRGGAAREASYARTLAGAVDRYTDPAGKQTHYVRDSAGRLTKTEDDELITDLHYDPLGRLSSYTVTDPVTKVTFTTALTHDAFGRETGRTVNDGEAAHTLAVTQTWTPDGLLAERLTQWGGTTVRKETYAYDVRSRLVSYGVLGSSLPQDAYGHDIKGQTWQYDALNNLTVVTTRLADEGTDTATCHYGNRDDPTQLTSVAHTHDSYPRTVTLEYDAEGRMTLDEAGRTLVYDVPGRLVSVSGNGVSCGYGYDALDRLVSQRVSATETRQLYYRGGERVNERRVQENKDVRLINAGAACVGVSDGGSLTLMAGNQHGSRLWSRDVGQQDAEQYGWTPYGSGKAVEGLPGFNGERADPVTQAYHLGNGYRAYSPSLMRFTCPDSQSPFGGGGINPYAYCEGDPVNLTDPSGHQGRPDYFWDVMTAAITIVGLAATLLSGGLAIAAAGGIAAAAGAVSTTALVAGGLGVAADVTALASIATGYSNPAASSALGWASMGLGLGGAAAALAGVRWAQAARWRMSDGNMRMLQLGGEVTDFRMTNTDVGIFVDTYKGRPRLNVFAHGQYVDTTRPGQRTPVGSYLINSRSDSDFGQLLSADRFVNSAKAVGVDFNQYGYIRTLACYSGDGGQTSFAAKLSKLTGKPVKGYSGNLNVDPTVDADKFYSIFKRYYSNDPSGFVRDVLAPRGSLFKIYKDPRYNYLPMYFK